MIYKIKALSSLTLNNMLRSYLLSSPSTMDKKKKDYVVLKGKEGIKTSENKNFSYSKIRRAIIAGCIKVNDKVIKRPGYILKTQDIVTIDFNDKLFFYERPAKDIEYKFNKNDILFEDSSLIIVNKPAGIPLENTIGGGNKRTSMYSEVLAYLQKKNENLKDILYLGTVHRLDKCTSGAVVFSKTKEMNKLLHALFTNRQVKKTYIAVCGINKEEGVLQSFLPKDTQSAIKTLKQTLEELNSIKSKESNLLNEKQYIDKIVNLEFCIECYVKRVSKKTAPCKWGVVIGRKNKEGEGSKGLYSKTIFKGLGVKKAGNKTYLVLKAFLLTGRTHQIRVHLSSVGLSILGDTLYGGEEYERVLLHSSKLEFPSPLTNELIRVTAPCPFFNEMQ